MSTTAPKPPADADHACVKSLAASDPNPCLQPDCYISVQAAAFDVAAELETLRARAGWAAGALVEFVGVVRGPDVLALELEHYPGMTEKSLLAMAQLTQARFHTLAITVIHRVGRLQRGEPIVLVAVAAAHRHAAFEGAHFLMDYLKTQAPFWKKEHKTAGLSQWVDARAADDAALARWGDLPVLSHPGAGAT